MKFLTHSRVEGTHATLSASSSAWVRYDAEKMEKIWRTRQAIIRGTELHAFAAEAIRLGMKMEDTSATVNRYVNDCIGFRMTTEQMLYASDNAYGAADAISFRLQEELERYILRIFDLKTGLEEASVEQLEVYAAFFCIEYKWNPFEIDIELRIYQNDDVKIFIGDPDKIMHIMEQIKYLDKHISRWRAAEL